MCQGGEIVGVCGGFQMLGKEITDPGHVETGGCSKGLGLLDVQTELLPHKTTVQVQARSLNKYGESACQVEGYEIHMGVTTRANGVVPCFEIVSDSKTFFPTPGTREIPDLDGAISANGLVWGTYIHGVFDQPEFRRQWLNRVRGRKNLQPLDVGTSQAVSERFDHALDRWADHVENHLTMKPIFSAIGFPNSPPSENLPFD
jgi:adenosylcobyric acid synthase